MTMRFKYIKLFILIILGGVTFGYNISIIASSLPQIKTQFLASDNVISLIAGLVFGGTMIAKLTISFFNDIYGRRKTLLISGVLFAIGTLSIIFSPSINYILIGRLLQGFAGGLLMFTISLYIVEVANDNSRGSLIALYQLSFTIGIFLANLIGMFMFNIDWKITFLVLLMLTIIFVFIMYQLPCSPRWLFRHGKMDEVRRSLALNHTPGEVEQVIESWQNSKSLNQPANIFQRKYFKALFLVIIIAALNQMTGINAILQTSTVLIGNAGFGESAALLGSVGITGVNVVATFIGLYLIDRFPRNMLLGIGGLVIAFAHTLVAVNYFSHLNSPILLIDGLMLFMVAYAIGPGIIIWLVFSEYLPLPVRSQGIAIVGFINALTGFLISSLFLYVNKTLGTGWLFLICALCSLAYGLIPIFYLPDTNGKDIEQFDELFENK